MERVLVISARRFDFKDDEGRRVEGLQLVYVGDQADEGADRRGFPPMTTTVPVDVLAQLREVPGVYELDSRMRPGARGRPVVQVVGVRFEQPAELWPATAASSR